MRILRLELGFPRGPIEMHPFVTAVQGLDPANREVFVEAVRLLAAGSTAGIRGLLDVNGQLVELAGDQNPRVGPVTTEDVAVLLDELPMLAYNDPAALQAELDQVTKRAKIDAVHVEEVRADLDPAAAARLQNLRDLLGEDRNSQPDRLPIDGVKQLLAEFEKIEPHVFDMPAGVADLIERWDVLQASSINAEDLEANLASRISVAEAAVINAERELDEATIAATPKFLTAEDETRLEELAHPTEGRKKKARARTDEEEAELDALLKEVGQPSYTAYRMYRVAPTALASDRALVESAKGRLAAAQDELANLKMGGGAPELTKLKAELTAIRSAASEHLGTNIPEDLGPALNSLGVTLENPKWAALASELKSEMVDVVGIGVPVMVNSEVPAWVTDWVHSYESDPEAPSAGLDPAELARGIAEAEVALENHARSMARIDRLEAKAQAGRKQVGELTQALATAGTGVSPHPEDLLAHMDPIIDRIYRDAGGSAPFLIAGEFNGMSDADVVSILDAYKPVSAELQIIVVSDRTIVSQWARQAGPEHAVVSKAQGATF